MNIWKSRITDDNLEMFPLVPTKFIKEMTPLIYDHLNTLGERIDHYFPSPSSEHYDWVRDPVAQTASKTNIITLKEEEELADLSSDRSLSMPNYF